MSRYQHWEEIQKYFGDSREEHGMGVTKALNLSDMKLEDYLVDKYGLFLDLRSNDDNKNSREWEKNRKRFRREAAGELMDAQLNIENGRFYSAIY